MALAYAAQLDVVVHDLGKDKRMFFVTADGHGAIKSYVSGLEAELSGYRAKAYEAERGGGSGAGAGREEVEEMGGKGGGEWGS